MDKYTQWIEKHITTSGEAYGNCDQITKKMAEEFPELTRVRGHYYCIAWGERTHWWLTTPEGKIIDPTAAQFSSQGRGTYIPWNEGDKEPTGKCPNCGEYSWDHQDFCSDECGNAYVAYLGEKS